MADGITELSREDMIETYGGIVDAQVVKQSVMRGFVDMPMVAGTDTRTVRRMGDTTLQMVKDDNAGERTDTGSRNLDRAQVTVDTIVKAEDKVPLLKKIQSDVNLLREMGNDHGKTIGKFFDAAMLSMGVKTALSEVTAGVADGAIRGNQGRDLGDAFKSGYAQTLAASGEETDPDALYAMFEDIITDMQENDVDTDECAIFLRPKQKTVLMNNDKLISRDFSKENGDFADGTLKTLMGVPLISTARLSDPSVAIQSYLADLSEGQYAPTATELDCVGLIMHPTTLLGAEAIPLVSDVDYYKRDLSWFVTSYLSFAASSRRADYTGAVFKTV